MKKKATYWGLGLCLALGLSATAGYGLLPLASAGSAVQTVAEGNDATEEEPDPKLMALNYVPSVDQEISTTQNLSKITISFQRDIEFIRDCEVPIVITKDGQPYQTIYASNMDAVKYSGIAYDMELFVEPFSKAGKYEISFPANFVKIAQSIDEEVVYKNNQAFTFAYTVVQGFNYAIAPQVGTQYDQIYGEESGDKQTKWTVTFDGVTNIAINEAVAYPEDIASGARLAEFKSNKYTTASTVTLSAQGNVLTIVADADYKTPTTNLSTQYLVLSLPKGTLKLTTADGTVDSPAYTFGNYYVTVLPTSLLTVNPAPYSKEDFDGEEFRNITIDLGMDGFALGSTFYAKAYLYQYTPATNAVGRNQYAEYTLELDEKGRMLTLKMKDPTSPTVIKGNPHLWETGWYCIQFPASALKRTIDGASKNTMLTNILAYHIKGLNTVASQEILPAPGLVNPQTGISWVTMKFGSNMMALDKEISIYKKGEADKPIIKFAANDSQYVNMASATLPRISFPAINAVGEYIIEVPEGAFRQTTGSELLNERTLIEYTIPETVETLFSINNNDRISSVEQLTITFPGATKVELTENALPINFLRGTSVQAGYAWGPSIPEGATDKIVLTPAKPYSTVNATACILNIPANYWKVTKGDKVYSNPPYTINFYVDALGHPTLVPGEGSVNASDLLSVLFNAPEGWFVEAASATVAKLHLMPTDGSTLSTSAGNTFGEYVLTPVDTLDTYPALKIGPNTTVLDKRNIVYRLIANGNKNIKALPTGKYVLRTSNAVVSNYGKYNEYDVENDTLLVSLAKPKGPTDVYYNVKGLDQVNMSADNIRPRMEILPNEFVISAPEGYKIIPAENEKFRTKFYIKAGTTNIDMNDSISPDGKLILSLDSANYEKANKNAVGKTFVIGQYATGTTTRISNINAGSIGVQNAEGTDFINARFAPTFELTGPITDPFLTYTPATGDFKISEHAAGLNEILIATDKDVKNAINWTSTANGLILKDGTQIGTFNAFNFEEVDENTVKLAGFTPIEEEGTYTFLFPRGLFLYGQLETASKEFAINYKVTPLASIAIASTTPAAYENISQFTGITLNFDKELKSVKANGDLKYSVQNPLATTPAPIVSPNLVPVLNPDKKSVLVTFSEEDEAALKEAGKWPVVDPGNYTFNFDKNTIVVTDTEDNEYGIEFKNVTFSLLPETNKTFAPSGFYESLKDMEITFTDLKSVEKYEFAMEQITVKKGETVLPSTVTSSGNKLIVSLDEAVTKTGVYTLNIPAFTLKLTPNEGEPFFNNVITHDFDKQAAPALVKTYPVDKAQIDFFTNIILYYNYPASINRSCKEKCVLTRTTGEETVTLAELSNTSNKVKAPSATDDPNSMSIDFFTTKDFTPGVYTVKIPAGFFKVQGVPTEEKVLTYTILETYDISIVPPAYSTIETIPTITITFEGADKIEKANLTPNEDGEGVIALQCTATESEKEIDLTVTVEGNKAILTNNETNVPAGVYRLVLPHGAFKVTGNGKTQDSQEATYEYYKSNIPVPAINPAPGKINSKDLYGDITISYTDGTKFAQINKGTGAALFKLNEDGSRDGSAIVQYLYDFDKYGSARDKSEVVLTSDWAKEEKPDFKDGDKYAIWFTRGKLMVITEPTLLDPDDPESGSSDLLVSNTPIVYIYTILNVDSVDSVLDENGQFNIYTVDGKVVVLDGDINDVRNLEPGLYIINGQNYYIRK